jgi:phage tail tape-measure protein
VHLSCRAARGAWHSNFPARVARSRGPGRRAAPTTTTTPTILRRSMNGVARAIASVSGIESSETNDRTRLLRSTKIGSLPMSTCIVQLKEVSMDYKKELADANPENRDPITEEPGSHPVGTGLGSAGGAAAGVAIGTAVAGPVGAVVGGAIGAVAGGAAGHAASEAVNPTVEGEFWSRNYKNRPYYRSGKELGVRARLPPGMGIGGTKRERGKEVR